MTSSLTEFSEPLALHLLDEHRRRYERIKAWREAQSDPYFTDVTPQWRREFEQRRPKPPILFTEPVALARVLPERVPG